MEFFEIINEPNGSSFSLFGIEHLLILAVALGAILLALHLIQKMPEQRADICLKAMAVAVPLLELSHAVWLYLSGVQDIAKLLPLHLCGMQSFFIPLAVFTKKTYFQDYIYATSVLGGVFAILFLSGVADYYPLWHFQTIQTVIYHALLIIVPLALVFTGRHTPEIQRFPRVICIFLLVAMVAGVVDYAFGENYMFLMQPPLGTPLVWIYKVFGKLPYLIIAFWVLAGASLATHLPFLSRKRNGEEDLLAHQHL